MPSVIPLNNVPENSTEIVIIGSGLAGLAAGQLLREAGHNALILDKGPGQVNWRRETHHHCPAGGIDHRIGTG